MLFSTTPPPPPPEIRLVNMEENSKNWQQKSEKESTKNEQHKRKRKLVAQNLFSISDSRIEIVHVVILSLSRYIFVIRNFLPLYKSYKKDIPWV